MYQDVAVDLRVQAHPRPRSAAARGVAVAGWAYLAAVLMLLAFRLLPAEQARWLHVFGLPLYGAWAFLDFGSFLTATAASLAFVQVEPAPFDFLALLLMLASLVRRVSRPRCVPAAVGAWLLAASLALGLFSVAWWPGFDAGWRFFGITCYLCALMLCLYSAAEPGLLSSLVKGWMVGAMVAVCLSILALLWRNPMTVHLLYSTPIVRGNPLSFRVMGFFKDPNVFGGFMVPAALFALDAACRRFGEGARFWLPPACAFALCFMGVVLSYSRGAAIGLGCVLVGYMMLASLRPGGRRLTLRALALVTVMFAVVGGVLSFAALWPAAMERYRLHGYDVTRVNVQGAALSSSLGGGSSAPVPGQAPTGSSPAAPAPAKSPPQAGPAAPVPSPVPGPSAVPARPPLKAVAAPSYVQRLLVGIGPGQFERTFGQSSHSVYIRLLAEGGVIGLALLLAGLALMLFGPMLRASRLAGESAGALAAVAIAGMLAQGATIDILHWRHFWLLLALMPAAFWRRLDGTAAPSAPGRAPGGAGRAPGGAGRAPAGPRTPARRRRRRRRREWAHSFEAQDTRWRLSASGRWSTTRSSRPAPGVPWGRGEQPGRGVLARGPRLCYNQDVNASRSREGAAGPGRRLPEGKG